MNHTDHVHLIQAGIQPTTGTWADLGSGRGAFTLALAECLHPTSIIYSLDINARALDAQRHTIQQRFPHHTVHYRAADFTRALDLPPLDGIVMANALHFVRDKLPLLRRLRQTLKPAGRLILVEYDTDQGNRWVPYPLSFQRWQTLATEAGFTNTQRIASHPSSFLSAFFASLSLH